MTDFFDDLYDQIIQCERRVEEKQHLLTELRGQVQNCKDTIQQVVEDQFRLQKELLSKVEQYSEVELNQTSLEARLAILVTQKKTLEEENASLQRDLTSLTEELETEILGFCEVVESRSEELDLTVSGQQARQNKASEILTRLLAREQTLLKEIADYETHKECITGLEAERYCLQQSLCDLAHTKKELEECVVKEQERLDQLEEERQHLALTPNGGDEYKRLRSELTSLNTEALEEQCSQLQQQAHALQQQLHARQQQHLRQQLHHHQQPTNITTTESSDVAPISFNSSIGGQGLHLKDEEESALDGPHRVASRPWTHNASPETQSPLVQDVFDNDDEYMTVPDLEVSLTQKMEGKDELFRVCNRQKPVFKQSHC